MNREYRTILLILILLIVVFFINLICKFQQFAVVATTPFLFLADLMVLFSIAKTNKSAKRTTILLFLAFLFTFIIEIVGVKTGIVFGNYQYTNVLWLQILGVPLVIVLNWIVIIIGSFTVSSWIADYFSYQSTFIKIVLSAMLVAFLDYFLEPVATLLNYWQWDQEYISNQNYMAWFIISSFIIWALNKSKVNLRNKLAGLFYLLLLAYFIFLGLFISPC